MITRVLDDGGRVLHDCIVEGCAVSWDGEVIDAAAYAEQHATDATVPAPPAVTVEQGKPVPGASEPDSTVWYVRGDTATLRAPETP